MLREKNMLLEVEICSILKISIKYAPSGHPVKICPVFLFPIYLLIFFEKMKEKLWVFAETEIFAVTALLWFSSSQSYQLGAKKEGQKHCSGLVFPLLLWGIS